MYHQQSIPLDVLSNVQLPGLLRGRRIRLSVGAPQTDAMLLRRVLLRFAREPVASGLFSEKSG